MQVQADVVHLHDQPHHPVHAHGDEDGHHRQDRRLHPEAQVGHLVHGDDHDLQGQDEVRGDGPAHHGVLGLRTPLDGGLLVVGMPVAGELAPYLVRALIGQVGAAGQQQPRQDPGGEPVEQQQRGQDEHELVAQGALGDPPDHRQLAGRGRAGHVLRGHRGVVDHHARRLGRGASRSGGHVVHARGGEAGEGGDVVEQGYESDHGSSWGGADGRAGARAGRRSSIAAGTDTHRPGPVGDRAGACAADEAAGGLRRRSRWSPRDGSPGGRRCGAGPSRRRRRARAGPRSRRRWPPPRSARPGTSSAAGAS